MQYRALRDGYLGRYIHAGEVFTHNGKKPFWAECLNTGKPKESDKSDKSDKSDNETGETE